jgi:PAS domain S-box-containing protein
MDKQQNNKSQDLRERAQQLLHQQEVDTTRYASVGDMQQLIEELHIHQIELEMQNEELVRSRMQAEESRNNYVMLYEDAPVAYFTLDKNGLILQTNARGGELLGFDKHKLTGISFVRFIVPDYIKYFYDVYKRLQDGLFKQTCQLQLLNKSGKNLHIQLEAIMQLHHLSDQPRYMVTVTDITDLKKSRRSQAECPPFPEYYRSHARVVSIFVYGFAHFRSQRCFFTGYLHHPGKNHRQIPLQHFTCQPCQPR